MKRRIKGFFTLFLVLIISLPCLALGHGYIKYATALEKTSLSEAIANACSKEHYTKIEDIPQIYTDAVVSVEDRRYYRHNGFDAVGTMRAILVDIKALSLKEGGSTITQQLAKNLYFPKDNTIERKIAEIFMATQIEREYTKDEILEIYFNCIYYGSGYYGIYDASMGYFGKAPADMNDYEATLLAGVPNAPSVYSPKVNLSLAHNRQAKVVSTMLETEAITQTEATEILNMQTK